jgi:hypothetical protein
MTYDTHRTFTFTLTEVQSEQLVGAVMGAAYRAVRMLESPNLPIALEDLLRREVSDWHVLLKQIQGQLPGSPESAERTEV